MKTLKKVPVTYKLLGEEEYMPPKEEMEFGVIYVSIPYHTAIHICLCGTCGLQTVMPLNHDHITNRWGLVLKDDKISFIGSVGNYQFPCKSHYIITNSIANFV